MTAEKRSHLMAWLYCSLALFAVIFLVVIPVVEYLIEQNAESSPAIQTLEDMSLREAILLRMMEFCTALWIFAVGAAIGSYLNVLAYRLPLRKSVLWERSFCPKCDHQLSGRDNLPIIGWLQLSGKCRYCQQPISSRYPIIEATSGIILMILFFWQTLSGGWNIPVRIPNYYNGFVWIIFYTKWDLVGLMFWHAFMFYTLLAWWLIEFDRHSPPRYSVLLAWGIALLAALIWPDLLPVKVFGKTEFWLSQGSPWIGLVSSAGGLLAGWSVGIMITLVAGQVAGALFSKSPMYLSLTGAILGWQAVLVIAIVWLLYLLGGWIVQPKGFRLSVRTHGVLLCVIAVHHLFWRNIYESLSGLGLLANLFR